MRDVICLTSSLTSQEAIGKAIKQISKRKKAIMWEQLQTRGKKSLRFSSYAGIH